MAAQSLETGYRMDDQDLVPSEDVGILSTIMSSETLESPKPLIEWF
jgi:hypothetical protein